MARKDDSVKGINMIRRRMFVNLELDLLEDFFNYACQREENEIFNIFKDYDDGKYQGLDDLDNVLYVPFGRLQIAIKTVYYELISIIEHEVQHIFSILPVKQNIRENYLNNIERMKLNKKVWKVWDINFYKLLKLIELKSQTTIKVIPTFKTIENIRKIANSFKHRKGLIDSSLDNVETNRFPTFYKLEVADALRAISDIKEFFSSLYKTLGLENYY